MIFIKPKFCYMSVFSVVLPLIGVERKACPISLFMIEAVDNQLGFQHLFIVETTQLVHNVDSVS